MVDNAIMKCNMESVVIVRFTDDHQIKEVIERPIKLKELSIDLWLSELYKVLASIPRSVRREISLVIPPANIIFVQMIHVPDVTPDGLEEAIQFECEQKFPGGASEWYWDVYRPHKDQRESFAFAMRSDFADHFVDVLIRNKIEFSSICPGILLESYFRQKRKADGQVSLWVHLEKDCTFLGCLGQNCSYFRKLKLGTHELLNGIMNAQKIGAPKAEEMLKGFMDNPNIEYGALISYYVKQFAQKVRQELKSTELFFCRTFHQEPAQERSLSSDKALLILSFLNEPSLPIQNNGAENESMWTALTDEQRSMLLGMEAEIMGGYEAYMDSETERLKLFNQAFSGQVAFQSKNLSYLLLAIILTLLALGWVKYEQKQCLLMDAQCRNKSAHITEVEGDILRFRELADQDSKIKAFTGGAIQAFCAQKSWGDFLGGMQQAIENAGDTWIESFIWSDGLEGEGESIRVKMKFLGCDEDSKQAIPRKIEVCLDEIKQIPFVQEVVNTTISLWENYVITVEFTIKLKPEAGVLVR